MKRGLFFRLVTVFILAVSVAMTPVADLLHFSEPSFAAAGKKAKRKARKKSSSKKRKAGSGKNVIVYRCARCGEFWFKGADPRLDFVYSFSQCRYGGMHSWIRMK